MVSISNQHQSAADANLSDPEFQAKALEFNAERNTLKLHFFCFLFQAKVLEFNAERNTLKLQFVREIPQDVKKYEMYSNHVLKVGTAITSADGLSRAKIEEVDAEWHRDQPWALKNEHIGKPVRWGVAARGDDDG